MSAAKWGRRVYIAAAYGEAARAEDWAHRFRSAGHIIVSTWHAAPSPAGDAGLSSDGRRAAALKCLAEVDSADRVIVLSGGRPRGAYFEAGFAYALGKRVKWIGSDIAGAHPIFDALPEVLR